MNLNHIHSDPQWTTCQATLQNRLNSKKLDKPCCKKLFVQLSCRFYKLHAQPSGGHFQPRTLQCEPGHEPAAVQLLHCFLTQHLPDGRPADVTVQGGHVRLGAAGRLPLCRRSEWICGTYTDVDIYMYTH